MKKYFISYRVILLAWVAVYPLQAQLHIAGGETKKGGNRLISVLSDPGSRLYRPGAVFLKPDITVDGRMSETEWEQALAVTPFFNAGGPTDQTSVRVLYSQENIYLFWSVPKQGDPVADMPENDGVITTDDYVQVDLIPLLPDSISVGTGYYYSIAVNPAGLVWDSYFDPYRDGFFFSSWNSGTRVVTGIESGHWLVEMIIPYSGLDVHSDPGWKWNLEFHHGTPGPGRQKISSSHAGVTVRQDVMVRHPGLVSYFWPRPEYMQEVKPDMSKSVHKKARLTHLPSLPELNGGEDPGIWEGAQPLEIGRTDRMGKPISSNMAYARIGIRDNMLCFNLRADGANIQGRRDSEGGLGEGMAAQMSGVNGVFIDQALFRTECFWIILQPRHREADKIHQDYFLLQVNNNGVVRGTHYDKYGTPSRTWEPGIENDIYNTTTGWGTEVLLDIASLGVSPEYSRDWGMNLFRNRMTGEKDSELQAWKYTGGDFLNPARFGELTEVQIKDPYIFKRVVEERITQSRSLLAAYRETNRPKVRALEKRLNSIQTGSANQLREAESELGQIDQLLGLLEVRAYNQSAPQPSVSGLPLMDVQFIGVNGWAVGAMGTVMLTEDGGRSWQKVDIRSDADLYRVEFVNEQLGWAAGGRIRMGEKNEEMRHDKRGGLAYIYHTRDGGKTWECQFGERGRHLFALDFVDEKTGYAAGERGYFIKTNDGGKRWEVIPGTGTLNWLYGMSFLDHENGFAVGLNETVIRTSDGGRTWKNLEAEADRKFYGFRPIYRDISFNGMTGCIVGQNGSILVSHDGGETWKPSGTFYKNEIREMMQLRSVQFVSPLQGYALGELGSRIMYTEDGGLNWSYRSTGQKEWLRALWAGPDGKLTAVGERGKILESADRGMNWKQLHGQEPKVDIMVLMAHGDDAPLRLNSFYAHYTINEDRSIVDVEVISDLHSSEYEETYNLEHDRNAWMTGVGTSTNFVQFENGNNGANYYHYTQRLWEGEENIDRQMVAAIRAYRPDILITHGGILGDYDKPGHKVSGRSGLRAYESAGGSVDHWPELTRLGLEPWEPKKLYCTASESYPASIDLSWIAEEPLAGTGMNCREYGNYVIRNFQSQGVYNHSGRLKLCLVRARVEVPQKEVSIFDGLK